MSFCIMYSKGVYFMHTYYELVLLKNRSHSNINGTMFLQFAECELKQSCWLVNGVFITCAYALPSLWPPLVWKTGFDEILAKFGEKRRSCQAPWAMNHGRSSEGRSLDRHNLKCQSSCQHFTPLSKDTSVRVNVPIKTEIVWTCALLTIKGGRPDRRKLKFQCSSTRKLWVLKEKGHR